MRQRGHALLLGGAWGRRHLTAVEERRVGLAGAPHGAGDDAARVLQALRLVDDVRGPVLFLLSYEACVALDPRLPRKAPDPTLGPDVLVWRCEDTPLPQARTAPRGPWPRVCAADAAAREGHLGRVRAAHELLLDGVIYQANLAHRLAVEPATFEEGLGFFLDASEAACPPCAAFVDIPGWGSVVSLSPERFVEADLGTYEARTWPIKGTAPRGRNAEEDARNRDALCASEKDAAEHVMIVDLLRNDLGRLAVPGGVTVERLLDLLTVKNVHHLESTIHARLRADVRASDILLATVPGGSITGAPKSSAIESICSLEEGPRGPYTGVLGLRDGSRLMTSLLIRTWLRPDEGQGALHVGGGIVADSDPEAEWAETLHKAAAFGRRA